MIFKSCFLELKKISYEVSFISGEKGFALKSAFSDFSVATLCFSLAHVGVPYLFPSFLFSYMLGVSL